MRIILTDALTEPLEIAGIGEFFRQYLTWDYWSQKLPLIGSFAGRVLLAILVYVVASKIIHKLCKLIVASMNRANADTGVTQFVSSFAKAAMYFFLIVSIATSFGVKESSIAALLASSGVAIGLALQGGLSNLAGGVTTITSMAKNTAANGVWNRPPKPAAIPVISMTGLFSRICSLRPASWESVAPICTATPSRPALPPKRWVIQVPSITRGTRARGIWSLFFCPVSKTRDMPFKLKMLK